MGLDAEECAKAAIGSAAGPADRRRRRRLISEEEKSDGQPMEGPKGEESVGGGAPLFDIPELPRGQMLLFELLAAWGDDCLIGLRFVEIFTADGSRPALADIQSNAADMISGTLRSLFRVTDDGREGEEDDEHNGTAGGGRRNSADDGMWLCKYNSEGLQQRRLSTAPIQIAVHFCDPQTLAMIRISNYAGPDGHVALRGVRSLRIWLDDQCIFCGEICCAFPSVAGGDDDDDSADSSIGDTILFTTNDEILTRIAANDGAMEGAEGDDQIGTFFSSQPPAGGPSVESAALSRLAFSTRPTTGHLISPSPSPSALSAVRRKWSAEVRADEGRPAVEGAAATEDELEGEAEE
uniref:KATNIP domain-containing protein n=1 Tax=Globodera rostochiensis TaxID=31243 RepID=A0A914ICF0_GLORO